MNEKMYHIPGSDSVESEKSPSYYKRRKAVRVLVGSAAILGAGLGLGKGVEALTSTNLQFEGEKPVTVQTDETVWDIVTDNVEGIESVDTREVVDHVINDPANLDVFEDGAGIYPGEQIIVPEEVSSN